MDGKKNQCMGVVFSLINKLKSMDQDVDLKDSNSTNVSPRVSSTENPEKLHIKRTPSYSVSLSVDKTSPRPQPKRPPRPDISPRHPPSPPIKKDIPPVKIPEKQITTRVKLSEKGIGHRTQSTPPKLIAGQASSPSFTETAIISVQSFVRSFHAKAAFSPRFKCLSTNTQTLKNNPSLMKGLIQIQALVRSRLVWDTLKSKRRRNEIAKEVLTTEEKYVKSLEILLKIYKENMKALGEDVIPSNKLRSIFTDIEVIRGYNDLMLKNIRKRMEFWYSEGQRLGDIFLQFTDFLRVYTAYVNNYNSIANTIQELSQNPVVNKMLQECRSDPLTQGLEIQSFLIMPIQRIPRYVLLLNDLFKFTPKEHPDYDNLSVALKKMEDVAKYVNQKKKEAENLLGVSTVVSHLVGLDNPTDFNQPHRRYVRQGPLQESENANLTLKTLKIRYIFLFNDCIISTKEQTGVLGKRKTLTTALDIDTLRNSDILFKFLFMEYLYGGSIRDAEIEGLKDAAAIDLTFSSGKKIYLAFPNVQQRDDWTQDIDEAIMSCLEKKRSRLEVSPDEEKHHEVNYALHNVSHFSGYLHRLGQSGKWKQRYYVLINDVLYYYNKKEDVGVTEPSGVIYLLYSSVQFQSVVDRQFCFQLYTKARIYYFSTDSWKDRMVWINIIRHHISKHVDELEIKSKMLYVSSTIETPKERKEKKEVVEEAPKPKVTEEKSESEETSKKPQKVKKRKKSIRKMKTLNLKTIKSGEMYKISATNENKVSLYNFVLKPTELSYFKQGKSKAAGKFNLLLVKTISSSVVKTTIKNKSSSQTLDLFRIELLSADRKYYIGVPDHAEGAAWAEEIKKALNDLGKDIDEE